MSDPLSRLEELERIVRADPKLMQLLHVARALNIPQWRVVAGCIYQPVWNALTERAPGTGISDYDLIYFEEAELSNFLATTRRRARPSAPCQPCLPNRHRRWPCRASAAA